MRKEQKKKRFLNQEYAMMRYKEGATDQEIAQETGVSLTALRTRIAHLCAAVKSHTCESLAIPHECEDVLSIIRDRAERLKAGAS